MADGIPFKNHEGYADPTPCRAIAGVTDPRFRKGKFIVAIFLFIAREAGYKVTTRIELLDERTGISIK